MGVFVRPDSPFWWYHLEGTRTRVSTGVPREGGSPEQNKELRRQAQAIYASVMGKLAAGRHHLPSALDRRTFKEHREWYLAHVSAHKKGTLREASMLRQLGAFFDSYQLRDIDQALAREWRSTRLRTVKAATVNREEEILKHMLNQAVGKYLEQNPLAGMSRLRADDVETRILTPEEETALLTAAKDKTARAIVLCGLDALMRRGSIVALSRAQDHGGYLTLLNAKAGTYKVPVSTRLRKALDAVSRNGTRFFDQSAKEVSRLFEDLCARAEVTVGRELGGVTFHSLRHTGASRMLAAGVDIKTVMRVGGWRNMKVLERYLHPTDAVAVAAVNAIHVTAPRASKTGRRSRKKRK